MVRLFVTCNSHLEPVLEEELHEMGFKETKHGFRGVFVEVPDFASVCLINYCSRTASRVLLPLENFKVWDDKSLYKGALKIDWLAFLKLEETFSIDFSVNHPAFRNSLYAAQVLKDAICDQFRDKTGARPSVDTVQPSVQIHLFIHDGWATVSLDTSGVPLHKRGYRVDGGEAPLQENLAAALLRMAKYNKDEILFDPCMGSGTFLIEAALMATNTPPGFLRQKWGFQTHPDYNEKAWLKLKEQIDAKIIPLVPGKIFGIDINKSQVRYANSNLRTVGLHRGISISEGDFRSFCPQVKPTFLIANPPYGRRIGEESYLHPLYNALGDFFKRQAPARGFVLTTPEHTIGLKPSRRHIVTNGGIEARFFEYDLYNRESRPDRYVED